MSNSHVKPEAITTHQRIILFDGVCALCNGWVRFILRFDRGRNFKLCAVQSQAGQDILAYFDYPTTEFNTMLYIESGNHFERSSALIRVIRSLPLPFKLLAIVWLIPKPVRDWGYDLIARNRYRLFGRKDSCFLPEPRHNDRFL